MSGNIGFIKKWNLNDERGISCGKEVIKWDINILMWHWENL